MTKLTRSLAFSFLLAAGLGGVNASAQEFEWARSAGGPGFDGTVALRLDASGNAYTATLASQGGVMHFGSLTLTNDTSSTLYVARHNPDGSVAWVGSLAGVDGVSVAGVAVEGTGSVYVAGTFYGDLAWTSTTGQSVTSPVLSAPNDFVDFLPASESFVIKLDSTGKLIWAKPFGGPGNQECSGVAIDPSGNVFIGGQHQTGALFGAVTLPGAGQGSFWVAKLDSEGVVQWAASNSTSAPTAEGLKLATDATGNVFAAGQFADSLTAAGGTFKSAGDWDVFLLKYSPTGALAWVRTAGGKGAENLSGLTADSAGNVWLTGTLGVESSGAVYSGIFGGIPISGPLGSYLAKYDGAGTVLWAKNDGAAALASGAAGSVYGAGSTIIERTVGTTTYRATGYQDIFAAKWDASGAVVWTRAVADSEQDNGTDLAVDSAGNVWVVGNSFHTSTNSFLQVTNYGVTDGVIARFSVDALQLTRLPDNQSLPTGSSVVLSAGSAPSLSGLAPTTYQWYRNGSALSDTDRITGSATASLRLAGLDLTDEGVYTLRSTTDGQTRSGSTRLRVEGKLEFTKALPDQANAFALTFKALPGKSYDIEFSPDARQWTFLTNLFSLDGNLSHIDRTPRTKTNMRFYRAVSP